MPQTLAAMLALLLTVPDMGLGPNALLFFEPGSTELQGPRDRQYLDMFPREYVQARHRWPWVVVICAGLEDGSAAARRLAKARARLVRRQLSAGGVEPIELWPRRRCKGLWQMDKATVFVMTETRWTPGKMSRPRARARPAGR